MAASFTPAKGKVNSEKPLGARSQRQSGKSARTCNFDSRFPIGPGRNLLENGGIDDNFPGQQFVVIVPDINRRSPRRTPQVFRSETRYIGSPKWASPSLQMDTE